MYTFGGDPVVLAPYGMKTHKEMLRLALLLDGGAELSYPRSGGRLRQAVAPFFYKVVVSL